MYLCYYARFRAGNSIHMDTSPQTQNDGGTRAKKEEIYKGTRWRNFDNAVKKGKQKNAKL